MKITFDFSNIGLPESIQSLNPVRNRGRITFVFLDQHGKVGVSATRAVEGMPECVLYGRSIAWEINPWMNATLLKTYLREQAAQLQAIHDGHLVDQEGGTYRGTLSGKSVLLSKGFGHALKACSDLPENQFVTASEYIFGNSFLTEAWPENQTLDQAVARLEREIAGSARTVIGDIRTALIDEAENYFPWSTDLWKVHLNALVESGRIAKYLADGYLAEREELP